MARNRSGRCIAVSIAVLTAACRSSPPTNEVTELARAWSGPDPTTRCERTDPSGAMAVPEGSIFCEWLPASGGKSSARVRGVAATRGASTTIRWLRTGVSDADASRIVDSIGKAVTQRGLALRPCGTSVTPAGTVEHWLWESPRLSVHLSHVPGAPTLEISAADSRASLPGACPPLAKIAAAPDTLTAIEPSGPSAPKRHVNAQESDAAPEVGPPEVIETSPSPPVGELPEVSYVPTAPIAPEPPTLATVTITVPALSQRELDSTAAESAREASAALDSVAGPRLPGLRPYSFPILNEINTHGGMLGHYFGGSRALIPLVGFRMVPYRVGSIGIGFGFDWWLDGINLGPLFSFRTVRMDYFAPSAEFCWNLSGPWHTDIVLGVGLGIEAVRFSNRFDASAFFPASSINPAAMFSIGSRIPLTEDGRVMLRIDARARDGWAEVFDPSGVRTGRENSISPELSIGLSYVLKRASDRR